MTLEQYAYLAEIVGVMIIVLTFVFLAVQLRQGTQALRSATAQNINNQTMTAYAMLLQDPMMEIFIKGMREPSGLNSVEKGKFNAFLTVTLHSYQQVYLQILSGAYDARVQDGWWQLMRNSFLSPGFQHHWEQRKFMLDPEFRKFVETDVMSRDPSPGFTPRAATDDG